MSINAFGIFIMNNKNEIEEGINTAFIIQDVAIKHKLGLNQGINISIRSSNFIGQEYGFNIGELRFEMTDNPLDCNAEELFGGYDYDADIDTSKTLEYRMEKVKSFSEEIFYTGLISRIELHINIEVGYQYTMLDTTIGNFVEKVTKLFMDEDGWTPSVKVTIRDV